MRKLIAVLMIVLTVLSAADASASFFAEFADVGAGDCLLIDADGHTVMVDTGPASAIGKVSEVLNRSRISMIDCLVLTHPHPDHTGNLEYITDRYAVGTVVLSGTADYGGLRGVKMFRGDSMSFGDLVMTAVWPGESSLPLVNDNSLVLSVSYGGFTMLLAADAETNAEALMVAGNDLFPLKADLLKVGHHGMATSSAWPFIRAVHPLYAVVSCADSSKTPSLSPLTAETLTELGTEVILTTAENGNIRVQIEDGKLDIFTEK